MKLDIRRRVRLVALSGGILSFAGLCLIAVLGIVLAGDTATERGQVLEDSASGFVEAFAGEQVRRRISDHVVEKARYIERELEHTRWDAETLASTMTEIASAPENYRPRVLPRPGEEEIASGMPYLNMSRAVRAEDADGSALRAAAVASNIADTLSPQSRFYTGVFVGSKQGWLIAADTNPKGGPLRFSEKFLESYDPREMNWYKSAAAAKGPVFTDLYVDTNGNRCITCAVPFYDADGLAGVVGLDCNMGEIYRSTVGINRSGAVKTSFILNRNGEIMFSTDTEGTLAPTDGHRDLRQDGEKSLALEMTAMAAGKSDVALVTLDGHEYFLAYAPLQTLGWSFGLVVAQTDVTYPSRYARDNLSGQISEFADDMQDLAFRLASGGTVLILVLFGIVLWIGTRTSEHFVRPILSLIEGVKEISHGNLDKRLEIKTDDEIELLADSVNAMTVELKDYMKNLSQVTADKERIATELSVARKIQAGMLPSVAPDFSGQAAFALDASMTPAKEVGGDFYDFYMLDENRLAVTVADVSGKGVPAALFMVVAKNVLQNFAMAAKSGGDFADVVARVNDRLCEGNDQMMFVTVFFGVLELRTGRFDYVNAGHNPPVILRRDGEATYLLPEGKPDKPLGVMEGLPYHQDGLTLASGDTVFLYTDGVTEAVNEANELYGEDRLKAALVGAGSGVPVGELLSAVRDSLKNHEGAAEQADDITMLGLRYFGDGIGEG